MLIKINRSIDYDLSSNAQLSNTKSSNFFNNVFALTTRSKFNQSIIIKDLKYNEYVTECLLCISVEIQNNKYQLETQEFD